jgi:quinol monooxygenase YgiN
MKANYGFQATMTARPGRGDELVETLLIPTDGDGTDHDCLVYLVSRSASSPDVVHVTEGWTTKEAHAANFASARSQAILYKLAPLLIDAPQYHDFVPVGGAFRGIN